VRARTEGGERVGGARPSCPAHAKPCRKFCPEFASSHTTKLLTRTLHTQHSTFGTISSDLFCDDLTRTHRPHIAARLRLTKIRKVLPAFLGWPRGLPVSALITHRTYTRTHLPGRASPPCLHFIRGKKPSRPPTHTAQQITSLFPSQTPSFYHFACFRASETRGQLAATAAARAALALPLPLPAAPSLTRTHARRILMTD
jgi:hypothetical protein